MRVDEGFDNESACGVEQVAELPSRLSESAGLGTMEPKFAFSMWTSQVPPRPLSAALVMITVLPPCRGPRNCLAAASKCPLAPMKAWWLLESSLVAAREQLSSLKGSAYAVVRNTAVIGGRSPARRPRCR